MSIKPTILKDLLYLNTEYNEFQTFRFDKKLNDTKGITGINQVLNTTIDKNFITKDTIKDYDKRVHYNLWLELNSNERFSYKFRNQNNTPDNMILSSALFDKSNIDYKNKSFYVFKPEYLYKDGKINRWQINRKDKVHKGIGFSDHLPIVATFTTDNKEVFIKKEKHDNSISNLYNIDTLNQSYDLDNIIVIYKYKNNAIIKQKNGRAIYLYNCAKHLKLGSIYDLKVSKLDNFYGLKEIKSIDKLTLKNKTDEKLLYLDATKIDIFNPNYQNEIITNLKGIYKKGYIYFKDKKIKLYSKNKNLLPNEEQNVTIHSAHLAVYKNKPQIIIYKKSDYR